MLELRHTLELVNWGRQVIGNATQLAAVPWLDTVWTAVAAVVVGVVVALWGGRMLRAGVILAFMAAGAVAGKRFASSMQIDLLIGLVIGAGIAGLIGYIFYRWWLGLTIGTLAAMLVALTFSAPQLLDERQPFEDFRLGVGSGRYDTSHDMLYSMTDVRNYFWDQRRAFVLKTIGPVMVIGMIAFVAAVLAPRLASVLGTSVLGVLLLAGGAGVLTASKWPESWRAVQAHQTWALGGVGAFWLISLFYQLNHPSRPVAQVPAAPVLAPTA